MRELVPFLWGAFALGSAAIAVAFGRIRSRTGDSLFGWFAAAFALLALERIIVIAVQSQSEVNSAFVYLVRLLAFALILIAIRQKNRPSA